MINSNPKPANVDDQLIINGALFETELELSEAVEGTIRALKKGHDKPAWTKVRACKFILEASKHVAVPIATIRVCKKILKK